MIGAIGTYLFEKEKKKRLRGLSRANAGFDPKRKNYFGLLLDATHPDDRNIIIQFAEQLRRDGNRVKILGYVDGKLEGISISFDVFTSADLARFSGVPRNPLSESFMDQSFDILINMSIRENHKPLEYIAAVSKATFTVGPWFNNSDNNPYNLCVDAGKSPTLKDWIHQLMDTLQKLY